MGDPNWALATSLWLGPRGSLGYLPIHAIDVGKHFGHDLIESGRDFGVDVENPQQAHKVVIMV